MTDPEPSEPTDATTPAAALRGDRPPLPWGAIVAGALLLWAATPPVLAPGGALLVVPGLMVQFALATGDRRPLLASYLLGALHILAFSWSLRHVTWAGWAAIGALGGCYPVAAALLVRAAADRVRAPLVVAMTFGVAVAGVSFLRAEMPGIAYPHGQPCHGFWEWPWLLGSVRLGGEPLANGLLAALAAALLLCWRGWRTGLPALGPARRALAIVALAGAAVSFVGAPVARSESVATVAVAAVEPGIHLQLAFADVPREDRGAIERRWRQLIRTRLLAPTQDVAGAGVAGPPDLVLWPESSVPYVIQADRTGRLRFVGLRDALEFAPGVRLCLGADRYGEGGRITPAAALVDHDGAFLAHQEKQRLVPGGETLPLVSWLPDALADRIRNFARTAVGIPDARPGQALPPLRLSPRAGEGADGGVPFTALVCYDNAFPSVVAAAVDDGARFLAVLSNESWYRGGGELWQLAAMTVLRAVATETPIVRCTADGITMAVDRDGSVLGALPVEPAPAAEPRVLRVDLPLGSGALPPMARVHPWLGWGAAALVLAACLHALWQWARLKGRGQTAAGAGGGPRPEPSRGGS